jgi:integrase
VRNILTREVIQPLSSRFPRREGLKSFADGRLHSFRHYFASMCANQGTAERIAMEWLGHADSEMVRHYYHLHDDESRKQMAKLVLLDTAGKQSPGNDNGTASNKEKHQHEQPGPG